ncbi:TetR/AcrR family transcriptional regulator [Nocardia sp. NBC_01009]|uniref:TetR/AcrR family transcriptional regulator n=1 Tax=Nocardia sp. NBC_01009 TaxID=2975996 RepID=UPI00386C7881|nr:TetR/AcrR family transcriptional regulator [Nocardia sp. NBC_01009]
MTKPKGQDGLAQRPMRADARRNYEQLLVAARTAFAEHGIDASLDDIARRAEVGNATLYRHFPTRQALLEAVHRDQIEALSEEARELLTAQAPGEALATWLRAVAAHGSTSRGLVAALTAALHNGGSDMSWCRETIFAAATALLTRARQSRAVRPDITAAQLLKLVNAIAFVTERELDGGEQAEQLISLVMDGIRFREPVTASPVVDED